ncbi:hypothetical protein L7F22_043143 [Adiantum nelumboides]|nr:hypothetical protein [Adiantum nelumboides]
MPSKIRTQLMGSVQVLNQAEYQEGLGWMEVLPSQTTQEEVSRVVDESSTFQKVFSNLRWSSTFGYSSNTPFQRQRREEEKNVPSKKVSGETNQHSKLSKCYLDAHPDSSHWTPGSDDSDSPHKAMFVRIRIEKIYSVGGFGDEHRIGYVSKEAWERLGRSDRSSFSE